MSNNQDSDEYEYYIINDGLGISHLIRRPKEVHLSIRCKDCH